MTKPRKRMHLGAFGMILAVLTLWTGNSTAFDVNLHVLNRWNADASNTRELQIDITNYAGSQPDQITSMVFNMDVDPPGPGAEDCPTSTFSSGEWVNWYEGNGSYWIHVTSDTCYSYGGTISSKAGARDDGELQLTVYAGGGDSQSSPPATNRLAKWRHLAPPVQVSPNAGSKVTTDTPTLTWTPAVNHTDTSPLYYRVIIHLQSSGERVFSSSPWMPGITSLQVPPDVLKSGETYNWQVRAYDGTSYYDSANFARSEFLPFNVKINTPVPTITEWGMVAMSVLLIGSALWFIRRRKMS